MEFPVKGGRPENLRTDCLVVAIDPRDGGRTPSALEVVLGASARRLIADKDLGANAGQTCMLHGPSGMKAERVLLVSTGSGDALSAADLRKILKGALGALAATRLTQATLELGGLADRGVTLEQETRAR